ncbi:hypothetical protein ONZ45_g16072 [Pleurotus djamor]|nr:hypothetical protein ONZ45_g16072 [Pleurotus djamor]
MEDPTPFMSRPCRDDSGVTEDMKQSYYFTNDIFLDTDAAAILKTALKLFEDELRRDITCDYLVVQRGIRSMFWSDPRALIYAYDFEHKPMIKD